MEAYVNDLWLSFTLFEDKDKVRGFLQELLTHTEMKMLAKRLQIAILLMMNTPYHIIKETVSVQNTTIARINNILHTAPTGGLRQVAEKLIKIETGKRKTRTSDGRTTVKNLKNRTQELPYTFGSLQ